MEIHGHDTVFRFDKGCLGRAGPDAGRIIAMIAQHRELVVVYCLGTIIVGVFGKGVAETGLPDPLDLALWVGNVRDIMTL